MDVTFTSVLSVLLMFLPLSSDNTGMKSCRCGVSRCYPSAPSTPHQSLHPSFLWRFLLLSLPSLFSILNYNLIFSSSLHPPPFFLNLYLLNLTFLSLPFNIFSIPCFSIGEGSCFAYLETPGRPPLLICLFLPSSPLLFLAPVLSA